MNIRVRNTGMQKILKWLSYLSFSIIITSQNSHASNDHRFQALAQRIFSYTTQINTLVCGETTVNSLPTNGLAFINSALSNNMFQATVCNSYPVSERTECTEGPLSLENELDGLKNGINLYNSPNPPNYLKNILCETNGRVNYLMKNYLN